MYFVRTDYRIYILRTFYKYDARRYDKITKAFSQNLKSVWISLYRIKMRNSYSFNNTFYLECNVFQEFRVLS